MSELVARTDAEVVDKPRLDELAERIRTDHREIVKALERSLVRAISIGELLLEAKQMLPRGRFVKWVEDDCGLNSSTSRFYMRLAHYENVLPSGINQGEAMDYIRGLPPVDGRVVVQEYPAAVREEARRRRRAGQGLAEIASVLGTPTATIHRWCNPNRKDSAKARAAKRQLLRLSKREEKRQEAERAARKRGGSLGKSYSLMRQLAQELDAAAAAQPTGSELRRELRQALSKVHAAERHVCTALGVDYGSWREVE